MKIFKFLLILLILSAASVPLAQANSISDSLDTRTLTFSSKYSVGSITITPWGSLDDSQTRFYTGKARNTVVVPQGKQVEYYYSESDARYNTRFDNNDRFDTETLSGLPQESFQALHFSYLSPHTMSIGNAFDVLSKQKYIFAIYLGSCNVDSNNMALLSKYNTLNFIRLSNCNGEAPFSNLGKDSNVERIEVDGGTCEQLFSGLENFKSLKSINVNTIKSLTDKDIDRLSKLSNLKELTLGALDNVTVAGLNSLGNIKTLESLSLYEVSIPNVEELKFISGLTSLRQLSLRAGYYISDSALDRIVALKKLKNLDLQDSDISKSTQDLLKLKRPDIKLRIRSFYE